MLNNQQIRIVPKSEFTSFYLKMPTLRRISEISPSLSTFNGLKLKMEKPKNQHSPFNLAAETAIITYSNNSIPTEDQLSDL